jgi:predicted HicB family RNase H-like nuclease
MESEMSRERKAMMVRVDKKLHELIRREAFQANKSMNEVIVEALLKHLKK